MFRFEGLIEDRDVVRLHYALASLKVYDVAIVPAVNVKGGKNGKAKENGGSTMADIIGAELRQHKAASDIIVRTELFEIARKLGYSPNSNLQTNLIKTKVLKKKGRGEFVLLPPPSK